MLKTPASIVLSSSKSSTYPRGYASGVDSPAALLDGRFEHPAREFLCYVTRAVHRGSAELKWFLRSLLRSFVVCELSSHEVSGCKHRGSALAAGPYRRVLWRLCDGCAGVEATAVGRSVRPGGAGGDDGHGRDPLPHSPDGSCGENHDDRRDGLFD